MIRQYQFLKDNLKGTDLKNHKRKRRILNLLYQNHVVSGPQISKKIGVSLPTCLVLLNELVDKKLVEVRGAGKSSGGRKPTLFGLSKDTLFVVACELGRYSAKIAVFNTHNEKVKPEIVFETSIDDDELIEKIFSNIKQAVAEANIRDKQILGIGIAMPGLIDETAGINYTIKNPDLQNVKERLEEKCNKQVFINNDARAQAYGEFVFGEAKGYKNAIVINWNWGIGLGLILNGKLYNGAKGFAGELSHIKLVDNGDLCICGKRGCLETVTSVRIILKKAKEGIKNGVVSQLTNNFGNALSHLSVDDIINAAKQGDEFSISLLNEVGLALGEGLSVTIQLLNPDVIVLGGIMAKANQFVLTPIQQSLNRFCLEQISMNTKIVISDTWEDSGLLGITAALFSKMLND